MQLSTRYRIDGFQYGYIRGVDMMSENIELIDELYLFTIDPESKNRYLIGKLNYVEIIEGYQPEQDIINPLIKRDEKLLVEELKSVGAEFRQLKKYPHEANIKFKWSEIQIFNDPPIINRLRESPNKHKFNRFQPYEIDDNLDSILKDVAEIINKLNFESGKASTKKEFDKKTSGGKTKVTRKHSEITDSLFDYFKNELKINKDYLSAEKTRIGGAIADFVVLESVNTYSVFEVKTKVSAIQNIREAIGQLFEYAFLDPDVRIKKLAIVGPAHPQPYELEYFKTLQKLIDMPLEYWAFDLNKNNLKEKFTIYK